MTDDQNSPTKDVPTKLRRLDTDLQFDPTLVEGRASGLRITFYLIAALAVVGFVFWGINSN
jgi:hypothetical protein